MNKEEILKEIEKTKEHLANMEKMLKECEHVRWKPNDFSTYFYVDSCMKIEKYLDAQQKYFDGEDYHNLLDIINKVKGETDEES